MRKPLIGLCVVSAILLAAVLYKTSANAEILKLPHKSLVLPNGLRLFMVKYPSPGVVAYELPVHVGSRNEIDAGKSGFAHFFEHLMFRGTKNMSAKEFGDLYVKLGVENNAWTSYDMTNYHGVVATQFLDQILSAEADRFQNLFFEEKILRDEAGAVLGEYNKDIANPDTVMEEKLHELAYKVHPYGHTTLGYKQDILQYPERYKDVWPFFQRHYRPSNVSVILVGDLDFDKTLGVIQEKFGRWKNPELSEQIIPQEPPQTEAKYGEFSINQETQTRIAVAYKIPPFSTKEKSWAVLNLISELYFSRFSAFQKDLKFEKGWIDEVISIPAESIDEGLFTIQVQLTSEGMTKEKEVLESIDRVISDLSQNRPESRRVSDAINRLKNQALTSWFTTPQALADQIARFTNLESDLGVLDRVLERNSEVNPDDLSEFAVKYLTNTRKTTVILRGKK